MRMWITAVDELRVALWVVDTLHKSCEVLASSRVDRDTEVACNS